MPEVSLVAVLDADKEGFLRSRSALIQTAGRAARNVDGKVILYGDKVTRSMEAAIDETRRRRELQQAYNEEHGITPTTIKKKISDIIDTVYEADYVTIEVAEEEIAPLPMKLRSPKALEKEIKKIRTEMLAAAEKLEFEKAAALRDKIGELEKQLMSIL